MITFNQVPPDAAASRVFVEQENVNRGTGSALLGRKILILGQFNSGKNPTVNIPRRILSKADAWNLYGRGSLLAAMIEVALKEGGGVPVYALPLADNSAGVAAEGDILVGGTATKKGVAAAYVNGVKVSAAVNSGDSAEAIAIALIDAVNANLDLPVTASLDGAAVVFTSRWKGEASNQINISINLNELDETPEGISFMLTQMGDRTAGAEDPDISSALSGLGNEWYTDVVLPYDTDLAISAMEAVGDERDSALINRPFAGFVGYNGDFAGIISKAESRNSQWTTLVPVINSVTPPYMIAVTAASIFGKAQQVNPGRPVRTFKMPGIFSAPGNAIPWGQKDVLVKAGSSYTENQTDGSVTLGDLVTTKKTDASGADALDWRYTIIIPNLQFKRNALEQKYKSSPFDRAVVIQDGSGRGPTYAIRPSDAKVFAIGLVDDWVARGLSTERDRIVEGIVAEIDCANPSRINLLIPDIASAGLRIVAIKLEWAFVTG